MSTPPRAIAGILACACALVVGGLAPAQGEAELRLVLPGASLPGLHPTAPAPATAIADLAAGLPSQLAAIAARAEIQTSGASGVGRLLRSDAFAFASAATARRVLLAWRSARPARPARVGDGGYTWPRHAGRLTRVTIAWREGSRIGVIALSAARGVGDADAVAKSYAVLADGWLRTPLPRTAWGRVLEQIRPDGGVSKRTALDAFAVAYGPLPGVRVPAGSKTAAQSGTLAAEWILSYLPQLTAPQRRVVQLRLGLLGSVRSARVADLGDPGFHPEAGFQAIVDHWIGVESSNLGRPLGLKAVAGTTRTSVNAYADSLPLNAKGGYGAGQPAICRVRVPPIGQSQKSDFEQLVLAHEVFHCFQFDLLGTGAWKPPSAWITEGTADWVAQTVDPVTYDLGGGNLTAYIGSPMTPLFERSSDATGFWGHVQDTVGNLWQQLPAIITASSNRKAFVRHLRSGIRRVPVHLGQQLPALRGRAGRPSLAHLQPDRAASPGHARHARRYDQRLRHRRGTPLHDRGLHHQRGARPAARAHRPSGDRPVEPGQELHRFEGRLVLHRIRELQVPTELRRRGPPDPAAGAAGGARPDRQPGRLHRELR